MTTASETTIKLIQDRIAGLRRREEAEHNHVRIAQAELDLSKRKHAAIVVEREALETDLATLTVAVEDPAAEPAPDHIPGGDVSCPACKVEPGERCRAITARGFAANRVAVLSHPSRRDAAAQREW